MVYIWLWIIVVIIQNSSIIVNSSDLNDTAFNIWSNQTTTNIVHSRDDVFYASVYGTIACSIIAAICLRGFVMMLVGIVWWRTFHCIRDKLALLIMEINRNRLYRIIIIVNEQLIYDTNSTLV